ncbi:hypothetical protein [Desulfosarcina sp.]|uniref:hypothetical protein n=1 Tax=Desulfosarcina sp. TaxID=2027861 RepID=UPI0035662602
MNPLQSFSLPLIVGGVWLVFKSVPTIIRQLSLNLPVTVFLYELIGATIDIKTWLPRVKIEWTTVKKSAVSIMGPIRIIATPDKTKIQVR